MAAMGLPTGSSARLQEVLVYKDVVSSVTHHGLILPLPSPVHSLSSLATQSILLYEAQHTASGITFHHQLSSAHHAAQYRVHLNSVGSHQTQVVPDAHHRHPDHTQYLPDNKLYQRIIVHYCTARRTVRSHPTPFIPRRSSRRSWACIRSGASRPGRLSADVPSYRCTPSS